MRLSLPRADVELFDIPLSTFQTTRRIPYRFLRLVVQATGSRSQIADTPDAGADITEWELFGRLIAFGRYLSPEGQRLGAPAPVDAPSSRGLLGALRGVGIVGRALDDLDRIRLDQAL